MCAHFLTVLALGAALVAGADLAGFQIAQDPTLLVAFGEILATNGVVVAKNGKQLLLSCSSRGSSIVASSNLSSIVTAQQPLLAVPTQSTATSVTIMMVDLDIPSDIQPTTFLHWLQTDLPISSQETTIATSQGSIRGFSVSQKNTDAIVPYTQPSPPAKNPLSHRYAEILLDTSALTQASLAILQTAAQKRVNFDIKTTLETAGLSNSVIAWNFFNVTNSEVAGSGVKTTTTGNSTTGGEHSGKKGHGKKGDKTHGKTRGKNGNNRPNNNGTDVKDSSQGHSATNSTSGSGHGGGNKEGGKQEHGKGGKGAKNNGTATPDSGTATPNSGTATPDSGNNGTSSSPKAGGEVSSGGGGGSNGSAAINKPGTVTTGAASGRLSFTLYSEVLPLCLLGAVIAVF